MSNTTYLNAVKTTRNGSRGMVTATRYELIEVFEFGEKVVEKYLYYRTENQLSSTYKYYTNLDDPGCDRVALKTNYDGRWTKYEYDSENRVIKEVSPFGDAEIDTPEEQCQVTTYDFTKLDSAESADSSDYPRWRIQISVIWGQEIARNFQLFYSNRELTIKATKPNATFDDESNQVQATIFSNYYDQFYKSISK